MNRIILSFKFKLVNVNKYPSISLPLLDNIVSFSIFVSPLVSPPRSRHPSMSILRKSQGIRPSATMKQRLKYLKVWTKCPLDCKLYWYLKFLQKSFFICWITTLDILNFYLLIQTTCFEIFSPTIIIHRRVDFSSWGCI